MKSGYQFIRPETFLSVHCSSAGLKILVKDIGVTFQPVAKAYAELCHLFFTKDTCKLLSTSLLGTYTISNSFQYFIWKWCMPVPKLELLAVPYSYIPDWYDSFSRLTICFPEPNYLTY